MGGKMKKWILEKRWRIIFAGILIMAFPLITLALYLHFSGSAAIEERITAEVIADAQLYSIRIKH